jgi:hypothetical protein
MELSFAELAVLASAGSPKDRATLARDAAQLYPSTKFDATLALHEISVLVARRFLRLRSDQRLEITREGWAAMMDGLPVLENLRTALVNAKHQAVRF